LEQYRQHFVTSLAEALHKVTSLRNKYDDFGEWDDEEYDEYEEYVSEMPVRRPSSHRLSPPSPPPRPFSPTPKFVVLNGPPVLLETPPLFHEEPLPVVAAAPPKPAFSWGAPKVVQKSMDMSNIFAEEREAKEREAAEQERRRLRQQHQHQQYHHHHHQDPSRRRFRGGPSGPPPRMPQSNERLLVNPRADNRRKPLSSSSSSSSLETTTNTTTVRTELLCIHPKGHNSSCNLAHTCEEWTPKTCKYTKGCNRGDQCSYWHRGVETSREYLIRALRLDIVFFRKNKNQYMKTYRLPSS
jgi:hypothetical protein